MLEVRENEIALRK